jgi:hypothetical protein
VAHFVTSIDSSLSQEEAFAYMADFSNALEWDPSVSEARRSGDGFDLVASFGGRDVPLHYDVVELEAPRLVILEARRPSFTSRDTITVTPSGGGSVVHYDARLSFTGIGRLLDPLMQLAFNRVGARAAQGMRTALNP